MFNPIFLFSSLEGDLNLILLSKCTIYELGYLRLGGLFSHAAGYASVDIRYLQSFDTIVRDICHKVHILNVKLATFLSFSKYLAEQFYLGIVKMTAHLLYHPDITEELCTQVSIAYHSLTNHAQMGVNQFDNLVLGTDFASSYLIEFVAQAF